MLYRPQFYNGLRLRQVQGLQDGSLCKAKQYMTNTSKDNVPSEVRRDFLYYSAASVGAVAAGAAVCPMINSMNPAANVQALSTIRVNLSGIDPGTQLTVIWRGKPVFIRRRTVEEIENARMVDIEELPDPIDRNQNRPGQPATDENRALDERGEWLVMIGVCTHLGCVPLADAGDFGGWFCPCHGSHYDTAGRIRKGPAPENLLVPTAHFTSNGMLELG